MHRPAPGRRRGGCPAPAPPVRAGRGCARRGWRGRPDPAGRCPARRRWQRVHADRDCRPQGGAAARGRVPFLPPAVPRRPLGPARPARRCTCAARPWPPAPRITPPRRPPPSPPRLCGGRRRDGSDLAGGALSFAWSCLGTGCAALSAPGAASGVDARSLVVWPTDAAGRNTVRNTREKREEARGGADFSLSLSPSFPLSQTFSLLFFFFTRTQLPEGATLTFSWSRPP